MYYARTLLSSESEWVPLSPKLVPLQPLTVLILPEEDEPKDEIINEHVTKHVSNYSYIFFIINPQIIIV